MNPAGRPPVQAHLLLNLPLPASMSYIDHINQIQQFLEQVEPSTGRPVWVPANKIAARAPITAQDAYQLAKELTSLESEIYLRITRDECLWYPLVGASGALEESLQLQSKIESWVLTSLLEPDQVEDRAARFDQWIMIAFHCRKLGNLSTACTILRAFRRQALRRLRVTSAYLTRHQALEELQNLINPYDDYERVVALVAAPRKLTWCVPPLDAYIDCFSTGGSATVEQFLRKQTFSDSDGEDAAGPRYAIKRNEFLQAYMMNALDAASPVDEDWLDARTRELKAAEASLL
ncbi:ras GEF [Exidia glandulosa HHB12029]|uniref:Ras GEF n=1 Tax=Exidia glandulosa HHB12029 TaxID=1314781 RepID=A0A165KYY3_EXIGL|nr:ras GEF [Exidia glandulosa HHB12029]